jgi:hypothetical protein
MVTKLKTIAMPFTLIAPDMKEKGTKPGVQF